MLKIEKQGDDTLLFGSDDADGENAELADAFEGMEMPELAQLWDEARDRDEDGYYTMTVPAEHWPDLRDSLDAVAGRNSDEIQQDIHRLITERNEAASAE